MNVIASFGLRHLRSSLNILSKRTKGYVVYDCDVGTDDAWGLLMLLKGEDSKINKKKPSQNDYASIGKPQSYKILGVTCVQGNTDVDNATKNTVRVLDSADRCDIPVFRGCAEPIVPRSWIRTQYFHGKDGFGDLKHETEVDMKVVCKEHAVTAMYEFACQFPNKVDYILVGPLTNFAMCINLYGYDFLDKVRNVYIMGGNFKAKGNISKSAEFNFYMDPEAAYIVMEKVRNPILMVPWETCIEVDHGLSMDWRMKVIGGIDSKAMKLMTYVERAVYEPKNFRDWIVCDAMCVAAFMFPCIAIDKTQNYHACVELTGTHTRGQMVVDYLKMQKPNVNIVLALHKKNYKTIMAWAAGLDEKLLTFD